jgi:signal transduction histidine kinase
MISKLLRTLENGIRVMRSNTRLIFVGVLVFVFPLLFVVITQSFFDAAYTNIQTSEKQRVGILQDSLKSIIEKTSITQGGLQSILNEQAKQNQDITEMRIVQKTSEGLLIVNSLDEDSIGTYETSTELYQSALGATDSSLIFEFVIGGNRTWQVVRAATGSDGTTYYIFSEHSFKTVDSIMAARRQESYFGLTAIFLFLGGLAYWFARQIDWRKRHDALKKQLEERDLFTNMIAHEFRAPLTAINGYSSFLAESKTPTPDERRYVQNIQTSTSRLLTLVNDFLEVARIQSGKLSLEIKSLDVQTVLTGVVEALRPNATEKRLTLVYEPLVQPIMHATDAKRLHQVIQNLVSNSIKYTEKGTIELTCEQTPVAIVIRIKDTGMGISAEDQQKLFAPFARVGGVEKTSITGSGLGMWITKQLVEALKGSISVESIKNVGTHVVVTLKR